jgi:hypothetical protein
VVCGYLAELASRKLVRSTAQRMNPSFGGRLDSLENWRAKTASALADLMRFLEEHELLEGASTSTILDSLRLRLTSDRLVVAFVAEFSRGKSELINAMFFADAGRRVLPATPGRTTMCPVEIGYEDGVPTQLLLLPVQTRLDGRALADLRQQPQAWEAVQLDSADPDQLARALLEVTRTRRVPVAEARALGFWNDESSDDNPHVDRDGNVEVPAWRHALINYPHPLLRRGLVVLDTPGLNAIGAEPELTLGLLPSAHATVFILGADAGVTKSDLAVWRDHLGAQRGSHFIVLNKIDTLVDPLATSAEVEAQVERQVAETAAWLGVGPERVFPLSAREALAARVAGDAVALEASRLPRLESALADDLLPRRREMLTGIVVDGVAAVRAQVGRVLADRRRQLAEQTLELRGLRGKSGAKVRQMLQRVDQEAAEFEACTAQLRAIRTVQARMLKNALAGLASDRLRDEVVQMHKQARATLFNFGAKKAFAALCDRLRAMLTKSRKQAQEMREMLAASFVKLNSEYGFSLAADTSADLGRFGAELDTIEQNYVHYLGLSQALKLSEPGFIDQFRRMLLSKLRVIFENACCELELWSRSVSSQLDTQLRERRRNFRRRREALERIQSAANELEARLAELAAQDQRLQQLHDGLAERADAVCAEARSVGASADAPEGQGAEAARGARIALAG